MCGLGRPAFTLHGFLAKHRASYNTLQRCAEHVAVELPNERTRVGYILKNIECNDKDVTAALANICQDDNPGGMRQTFESAVAFLLPTDPVKKRRGGKRAAAQISATVAAATTSQDDKSVDKDGQQRKKPRFKPSTGKTWVEFRYHTHKEFIALSKEQREELISHRKANGGYRDTWSGKIKTKGGNGKGKGSFDSRVAAVIKAKEIEKEKEQEKQEATRTAFVDEVKGILTDHLSGNVGSKRPRIAGANVASTQGGEQCSPVDRVANALMDKFLSMGTKAKKTG